MFKLTLRDKDGTHILDGAGDAVIQLNCWKVGVIIEVRKRESTLKIYHSWGRIGGGAETLVMTMDEVGKITLPRNALVTYNLLRTYLKRNLTMLKKGADNEG